MKANIIFATDEYTEIDSSITAKSHITVTLLRGLLSDVIEPRVSKSLAQQQERTRNKAEVFTPSWICNKMNNYCDAEWFGRPDVFNIETGQDWIPTETPIQFEKPEDWKRYVDSKRLEITCGEAPYIVSRYDASTGEIIEIKKRMGLLDRKLRVVNENTDNEEDWLKWAIRAYQSTYGYEFQGDSLLIARVNLLVTFVDYMQERWARVPTTDELKMIVNIICWNFWQMDGLSGTVPLGKLEDEFRQMTFLDFIEGEEKKEKPKKVQCRIFDWRSKESVEFNSLKRGY
ncbi:MAG: hypothetical protein IJA20_07750 [Methanocorpusculum sp.]|nr:hypothetical protein [Methanocorpusculum sp.]